jgi:hypothetical protein
MKKRAIEESETALQEIVRVRPENEEKKAIKTFCNEEVRRKNQSAEANAALAELRKQQKVLKAELAKHKCLMLSKEDRARFEKSCAAAGFESMPPYLRTVKTNKDASITPEVIQEGIEALTPQDISECAEGRDDAAAVLKEVILKSIRRIIRSFTETTKLMHNMPRGQTSYDTDVADLNVAETMYKSWTTDQEIKKLLASRKIDPDLNKEHSILKERVESYFIRAGITTQRIVVDAKQYKLVRRVSVRKSKIGIGQVDKMLDQVLVGLNASAFKPAEVIRSLQILITSLPPETKSSIKLCAVKADDEDDK